MPHRLDDLYYEFFTPMQLSALKSSVEDNHKTLTDHLSKEERKIVSQIVDALEMICNCQTKTSFIQGFKAAVRPFTSADELVAAIEGYITFYNTRRYQRRLHCMTPMEFHYAIAA